jgi:hypothetical protein
VSLKNTSSSLLVALSVFLLLCPLVGMVSATVPSHYDLSTQSYFPQVRSQGAQGSCAAWAIDYYDWGYLEAKREGWTQASVGNDSQLFNPDFTYNRNDAGSFAAQGTLLISVGVCTLAYMPYNVTNNYTGSSAAIANAATHKAYAYVTVSYNTSHPQTYPPTFRFALP